MLTKFSLTTDNPYWTLLQASHAEHVAARDKHQSLLDLLQSKGVKFSDIENYLMNEAKSCGLYRKVYWDQKKKEMTYPPKQLLNQTAWYAALSNFLRWTKSNYRDYNITADKVARSNKKRTAVILRQTDATGNITESRTDLIGSKDTKAIGAASQALAVTNDLSVAQVQAIIINNWSVLGMIAEEKGAIDEFNALMLALGLDDETI